MKTRKNECPSCGAALDCAVIYPDGEAFCMECGEIFITNIKKNSYEKKI